MGSMDVNYIDKNGTTRKCIVLYDANSSYGLQIITDKTVEKVNLGGGVGNGNSTVQEYNAARNSYNNTVIYLNDLANTYVNLKYSEEKSARSVGTVPNNPYLEVGYFAAKYTSDKLRATDTYYSTDVEELKKLNILNIGEEYFLASRYCFNGEYTTDFCLRFVGASGGVSYICVCSARSNGTVYGRTLSYGLRPIFKLKENVLIDTGDGTFDNPYNLTVEE